MRKSSAIVFALLATGCTGGLVLAPHRAREAELGPAAAEGRPAAIVDRAGTFEKQNAKSRDVYWYRVWRASAMVALGQVAEGEAVIDSVLTEVASPEVTVAEPQRLRMFAYDEKAKAALAVNNPAGALGFMDRALQLALEVDPDTGGKCDRDLALAARNRRVQVVALAAGDSGRASRADAEVTKRLGDWAVCLGKRDYPAMQALVALGGLVGGAAPAAAAAPAAPVAVAPAAPAPAPAPAAPVAPAPAAAAPAAAPAAPAAPAAKGPVVISTGLKVQNVRYGPVDPTPYKDAIDSVMKLVERQYKSAQADALIRVDGGKRALRVRVAAKRFESVAPLIPLFKNMQIFFDRTRDVEPRVDEIMVQVEAAEGSVQVVAQRADILDLFLDKIDDAAFTARLVEVR